MGSGVRRGRSRDAALAQLLQIEGVGVLNLDDDHEAPGRHLAQLRRHRGGAATQSRRAATGALPPAAFADHSPSSASRTEVGDGAVGDVIEVCSTSTSRGSGTKSRRRYSAKVAERQVGEQQGTGTKSSTRNQFGSWAATASITSELVGFGERVGVDPEAPGVGDRLEEDAGNRRVFDAEADDRPDLVLVRRARPPPPARH